jgi:predicted TIM-barrel fold metal-dependent hydrolase
MIVDSHVHLITSVTGYYAYKKSAGAFDSQIWDAERIVRLLDEVGFDRCFLLTLAGLYGFNDRRGANDEIAAAVRRFPDRFIGLATNWPNEDPEGAAQELLRCLDLGLRGVKYHPWLQSFPANSAHLYPTLEITSKYRLPVLFHTGTPPYSQPFQVMEQARRFPETPFIIGHFGKLLFLDAVRSAELCSNVYLETSGAQVADLAFALERIPAERILFGTDLPVGGPAAGRWNLAKLESAPLSSAQRRLILGENAMRLMSEVRL